MRGNVSTGFARNDTLEGFSAARLDKSRRDIQRHENPAGLVLAFQLSNADFNPGPLQCLGKILWF